MKIALISNLYPPYDRGGAEKIAANIANEFKKENEVILISTKPHGLRAEKELLHGITLYRFRPLNIYYYPDDYKHNALVRLIWHFFDLFNLHSYFTVRKILKNEKPDLVLTHNLMGLGSLVPCLLKKSKWIHTLHDVQLAIPSGLIIKGHENDFLTAGFLTKLYSWINKKLFNSPEKVISPSKWLLDFHVKKGFFKNSDTQILPNPIASEPKAEPKIKSAGPLKLFFAGQIQTHKGIIFLATALKYSKLDFKLIIAGSGTKDIELKSIIHDDNRFRFLGKITAEQINDVLSFCDYLIVPSLCYENSPTVIYEAFSQGVPVIASNIGGIGELVKENYSGLVFDADNEQSMLAAVEKADNIQNYTEISKNCLNIIRNSQITNYCDKLLNS